MQECCDDCIRVRRLLQKVISSYCGFYCCFYFLLACREISILYRIVDLFTEEPVLTIRSCEVLSAVVGPLSIKEIHLRPPVSEDTMSAAPDTRLNRILNPIESPKNWSIPINEMTTNAARHGLQNAEENDERDARQTNSFYKN
jgi:hypothetical protein